MHERKPWFQTLIFMLLTFVGSEFTNASQTDLKVVNIGYWRISLPPYIMVGKDNGIFVDTTRNAFASQKVNSKSQYFTSYQEATTALKNGYIDALAMAKEDLGNKYFYSDPVFVLQNFAISLKKNNFKIQRRQDLKGYRVIAFPRAHVLLGLPELPQQEPALYREVSDQRVQVDLLFYGKADIVLTDKYIFNYYRKQAAYQLVGIDSPYRETPSYHNLFPNKSRYNMAFKTEEMRDVFMKGYNQLKENNGIETIRNYYIELMTGL